MQSVKRFGPIHSYDWRLYDIEGKEGLETEIRGYCVNVPKIIPETGKIETSDMILVRIKDYHPRFTVELPSHINGRLVAWNPAQQMKLYAQIRKASFAKPISFEFFENETLHYFKRGETTKMMKLKFKSTKDMYTCSRFLTSKPIEFPFGGVYLKVDELSISTVIKLVNDITIETGIKMKQCTFFTFVPSQELADEKNKISYAKREFVVSYKNIRPLTEDESTGLISNPRVLSFDIETYADNHYTFPSALRSKDPAYIITASVANNSDIQCEKYVDGKKKNLSQYKKYALLTVDCNETETGEIRYTIDECDMVDEFCNVIREERPNIIIGYNINYFDYAYLNTRISRKLHEWTNCSWLKDVQLEMFEKTLDSNGTGYNELSFLDIHGCITIDMLMVVKNLFKLRVYTLDFVSKKFLNKGKNPVSYKDMFQFYKELKESKLAYNKLLDQEKSGDLVSKDTIEVAKKRYHKAIENETTVVEYAFEDTVLPLELFKLFNVWIAYVETANVSSVNIMDLIIGGQQERTISQLYTEALTSGITIDHRPKPPRVPLMGGLVRCIPGIDKNVIILDFSSLYPSICVWKNICYTTFLPPDLWHTVPEEDCNIFKFSQTEIDDSLEDNPDKKVETRAAKIKNDKNLKTKEVSYEYRFVKKHVREGLIPRMILKLLKERNRVKDAMKGEKDPLKKEILNQRQLAIKITNNSIYGTLAAQIKGRLPLAEAAACITFTGRDEITKCNEYVEKTYGASVPFNDTDSAGFIIPGLNTKESMEMGDKICEELNKWYPDGTMSIEQEKCAIQLRFAPKRYVFCPANKQGEYIITKDNLIKKGLASQRRDIATFVSDNYDELLVLAVKQVPLSVAISHICDVIAELFSGNVDPDRLSISGGLSASYESDGAFMLIFSERMAELGNPIQAGSRVEYIILETKEEREAKVSGKKASVKLGEKLMLYERYVSLDPKDRDPIDYMYYLEHKMGNNFNQCISIAWAKEMEAYSKEGYIPKSARKKMRPASKLIDMIICAMEDGHHWSDVLDFVREMFGIKIRDGI